MIQELHAGDRQIPASGWNEMRAAVQGITPAQQQYQSGKFNPAYITVENATGAALPALSIVRLGAAMYSSRTGSDFADLAIKNGVEIGGYTPAAATDTIAITQAACAAGGLVKAIVSGATACYINRPNGIACKYARVTSRTDYLEGTDTPTNIKVLWVAGGTGVKAAYVRLGTYNPQIIVSVAVTGQTGGSNAVYATVDGIQYEVLLPNANAGLSAPNYPDIYPGDEILILIDSDAGLCYGIDYPTDYEEGTWMAFCSIQGSPGRGWDAQTTDPAMTAAGFTLYQKVKTGAIL